MPVKRKNYDQELVTARLKIMYAIEDLKYAHGLLTKRINRTAKNEFIKC